MESSVKYRDISVFSEDTRSDDEQVIIHTCPYCHDECEIRHVEPPLSLHKTESPQLHTCEACERAYRLLTPRPELTGVSRDDATGEYYVYQEEYFEETFEELLEQKQQRYEDALTETQSYWQLLGRSSILPQTISVDDPIYGYIVGLFTFAFVVGLVQRPILTLAVTSILVLAVAKIAYVYASLTESDEEHAGAYLSGHAESGNRTMKLYLRLLSI